MEMNMNFLTHTGAASADETNVSTGGTLAGPGLAAHGYDVVAFFADGSPTVGSDKFALAHKGGTYRFASQTNLDAFKADADKYLAASARTARRSERSSTATRAFGRSSTARSTSI
jgi:YHS domain-containing protein